jgi:hypothetical protein
MVDPGAGACAVVVIGVEEGGSGADADLITLGNDTASDVVCGVSGFDVRICTAPQSNESTNLK